MGKNKKNVCAHPECKKKINVVDLLSSVCKCKQVFCLAHRLPEAHDCVYDYIKEVDVKREIEKLKCVSEYDKI